MASIDQRLKQLEELNKHHSQVFCSTDAQMQRKLYRAQHQTKIVAFQCMDGRIHIPFITKTPLGIIKSFRNLGGKFNLGWYYFGAVVEEEVNYALSRGQKIIVIDSYHFAKGSVHRGCAGCNYRKEDSIREAATLKVQTERIYGSSGQVVCPIIVGVETDEDALIFHGDDISKTLDLSEVKGEDKHALRVLLRKLYRKMPEDMLEDLLPLALGNIRHIAEIKKKKRAIVEVEHQEDVLAVGRGFDWLFQPNKALIVGPYEPDLSVPIKKAAGIILSNMEAGRIPSDGFILLTSAVFRSGAGVPKALARERALNLSEAAQKTVRECCGGMHELMRPLTVVTNLDTRRFELVKA